MPSKKTTVASPVKNPVNEEIIDFMWCVTDRLGLYVQAYNDVEPVQGDEPNDLLCRMGYIRGVSWSGVYPHEGKNLNVFKLEVETKGSTGVNQTGEGDIQTYVVSEENFTDFSSEHYRTNYLKAGEEGCTNVDQDLVDISCTPNRPKNGMWLKKWFNSYRGTETESSAQPIRTQPRLPVVFGEDNRANQTSQATGSSNLDKQNEDSDCFILPAPAKSPPINRAGNIYRTSSMFWCVMYV